MGRIRALLLQKAPRRIPHRTAAGKRRPASSHWPPAHRGLRSLRRMGRAPSDRGRTIDPMDSDARTGQGQSTGLLSNAHTALLVSAVMVPVTGAVVRLVQYATSATLPEPMRLAVSAPLPELAGWGLPVVLILGVFLAYTEYALPRVFRLSRSTRRSPSWLVVVGLAALLALVWALGILIFGLPLMVVALVGYVAAVVLAWRRWLRGAWSDRFALGALCLLYLTAGAFAGLLTAPPPAAYVTFTDSPNSPQPGWYLELGQTDQAVFLTPCSAHGRVLALHPSRLAVVDWPPPAPHDRLTDLRDVAARNLYAGCP
jgi:hypothetical protein